MSPTSKTSLKDKYAVAGNLRNLGYRSQNDSDEQGQWRTLKNVVYPRSYIYPKDNIAILWTHKPFIYNSFVDFIPIAKKGKDYVEECLVSGFGRISKKELSEKLLVAYLQLIPYRACIIKYAGRNMRNFICTSDLVTYVSKGDYGGPLVCYNTGDPNEVEGKGILFFMFTFYLYFTFILINLLDVSVSKSDNESDLHLNDFVPRVVNGRPAKLGDVPYQIAFKMLVKRTRIYATFCGGVITSPTKLLSAAHCFTRDQNVCFKMCGIGVKKNSLVNKYAVAGNLRNRGYRSQIDSDEEGQWRTLKDVVYPRTYRFPRDDIAILWTHRPFIYNSYVDFIPIASINTDYIGECLVSGFGRISGKATSDKLLLANLKLISARNCNYMHRRNMRLFVCTSSALTDVGKGDSGGPLVCANTGDPNEVGGKGILVGVVSGHRYRVGSFFTRVSAYYSYIERNRCSGPK
ncbi:coagulation factor IX-like [Pararge aegeria]|uniref:coagulation factor IX-like n=1 Tax=Pararge aegeria TaxID=116150 RepID=UPI0019D05782|nr:coagulation factor IX-like [Pararge aegeria]